jgi:voltage-gated potassium channel
MMSSRQQQTPVRSYRERTYKLFNPGSGDKWGTRIDWAIMTLIAVNVAAVILETVDPLHARYDRFFRLIEVVSVTVFSVEYIARIWSGVEAKWEETEATALSLREWLRDRLQIVFRPLLIVDLLAILPFYLSVLGLGIDLRILRSLRLIRFLRLLKLVRYSHSMRAFGHAFRRKKDQLIVALTANGLLLLIASSLMYFIETDAQPEAFGSIPEAMWWGIATLTTVGYGDVTPVTPLGQFVGSIVAVLGIGLFALPASIMASGFIEASSYETRECPECGCEIDWEDSI